jgi:hypothetical protein
MNHVNKLFKLLIDNIYRRFEMNKKTKKELEQLKEQWLVTYDKQKIKQIAEKVAAILIENPDVTSLEYWLFVIGSES